MSYVCTSHGGRGIRSSNQMGAGTAGRGGRAASSLSSHPQNFLLGNLGAYINIEHTLELKTKNKHY